MSELTYKKITDVEQASALNDTATVFINDNGAMKQVGAKKFGAVKTVNGIGPDESGNIVVEIPEPVQPDWNQNDPTAADYVKNRTHYDGEITAQAFITDMTYDFTDGSYYPEDITLPMSNGEQYVITWDGVVYERTAVNTGAGVCYVGNGSAWDWGDDTGEPFLFIDEGYGLSVNSCGDNYDGEHTFSVVCMIQHIEKLPERFLPDNVITTGNLSEHAVGAHYYVDGERCGEIFNSDNNAALGHNSHAEGTSNDAIGNSSHVEGCANRVTGSNAHAEGTLNHVSGYASHAEGEENHVSGRASHAEGQNTIAAGESQHVQGKYNVEDTSNTYAHIVGNGITNEARSNAHTLDWSGNAWFAGTVEGTGVIIPSSTAGSTKRFLITVDDSGTLTATEV